MWAEAPAAVLAHAFVDAGDAVAVFCGADHLGAEFVLQRLVAAGVVPMVVSVEDVGELQARFGEGGLHRPRLGGIDHRAQPGVAVGQQVGVIVFQAGNQGDGQAHLVLLWGASLTTQGPPVYWAVSRIRPVTCISTPASSPISMKVPWGRSPGG